MLCFQVIQDCCVHAPDNLSRTGSFSFDGFLFFNIRLRSPYVLLRWLLLCDLCITWCLGEVQLSAKI